MSPLKQPVKKKSSKKRVASKLLYKPEISTKEEPYENDTYSSGREKNKARKKSEGPFGIQVNKVKKKDIISAEDIPKDVLFKLLKDIESAIEGLNLSSSFSTAILAHVSTARAILTEEYKKFKNYVTVVDSVKNLISALKVFNENVNSFELPKGATTDIEFLSDLWKK